MEENTNENLDSQNQDGANENQDSEENQSHETDANHGDTETKNRQLYERAKKAEKEVKELRNQLKNTADSNAGQTEKKADLSEPDYGRLAFLNSLEIKHPDDQKAVIEESQRLKLPLSDILQMEHIQSKLKVNRETREAQAGMPTSKGRSGGASQKDVDYWVAKGGLPENQDLAEKVVDARMAQEKSNRFSDVMFNE